MAAIGGKTNKLIQAAIMDNESTCNNLTEAEKALRLQRRQAYLSEGNVLGPEEEVPDTYMPAGYVEQLETNWSDCEFAEFMHANLGDPSNQQQLQYIQPMMPTNYEMAPPGYYETNLDIQRQILATQQAMLAAAMDTLASQRATEKHAATMAEQQAQLIQLNFQGPPPVTSELQVGSWTSSQEDTAMDVDPTPPTVSFNGLTPQILFDFLLFAKDSGLILRHAKCHVKVSDLLTALQHYLKKPQQLPPSKARLTKDMQACFVHIAENPSVMDHLNQDHPCRSFRLEGKTHRRYKILDHDFVPPLSIPSR